MFVGWFVKYGKSCWPVFFLILGHIVQHWPRKNSLRFEADSKHRADVLIIFPYAKGLGGALRSQSALLVMYLLARLFLLSCLNEPY